MRFRLEQSLREGWIGLVLTTIIYPIWIVGASVHRVTGQSSRWYVGLIFYWAGALIGE